jgi:hypothetical protein
MDLQKYFLPLTIAAAIVALYLFFRQSGNGGVVPAQSVTVASVPNAAASGLTPSVGAVTSVSTNVPAYNTQPYPVDYLTDPTQAQPSASQNVSTGAGVQSSSPIVPAGIQSIVSLLIGGNAPAQTPTAPVNYSQQFYGAGNPNTTPPVNQASNMGPQSDLTKIGATSTTPTSITANSFGESCGCGGSCNSCSGGYTFSDSPGSTPVAPNRQSQIKQSQSNGWMPLAAANTAAYLAVEAGSSPLPTLTSGQPSAPITSSPTNGSPAQAPTSWNLSQFVKSPFRSSGFVSYN